MNDEFKTETNEPFAVFQVPQVILDDITNMKLFVYKLEELIGVKVLVVSQDVRLLMRGEARSEVERMYDEIEAFLDKPKEPADMTVDEMKAEVNRLDQRRNEIGKQIGAIRRELAKLEGADE